MLKIGISLFWARRLFVRYINYFYKVPIYNKAKCKICLDVKLWKIYSIIIKFVVSKVEGQFGFYRDIWKIFFVRYLESTHKL